MQITLSLVLATWYVFILASLAFPQSVATSDHDEILATTGKAKGFYAEEKKNMDLDINTSSNKHQLKSRSTERRANVMVFNGLGTPIQAIVVGHRYGDHKDLEVRKEWREALQPNQMTDNSMQVKFFTGIDATSRDYWTVWWLSPSDQSVHYLDPEGGGFLQQWLKTLAQAALDTLAASAASFLAALATGGNPFVMAGAGGTAAAFMQALTGEFLNDEDFKRWEVFTLHGSDHAMDIRIEIGERGVTIRASPLTGQSEVIKTSSLPISQFSPPQPLRFRRKKDI